MEIDTESYKIVVSKKELKEYHYPSWQLLWLTDALFIVAAINYAIIELQNLNFFSSLFISLSYIGILIYFFGW